MKTPLRTARIHMRIIAWIQRIGKVPFRLIPKEIEAIVGEDFTDVWDTFIDSFVVMNLKNEDNGIDFTFTQ